MQLHQTFTGVFGLRLFDAVLAGVRSFRALRELQGVLKLATIFAGLEAGERGFLRRLRGLSLGASQSLDARA